MRDNEELYKSERTGSTVKGHTCSGHWPVSLTQLPKDCASSGRHDGEVPKNLLQWALFLPSTRHHSFLAQSTSPISCSPTSVVSFHHPRNDRHLHSYHLCPGFGFDNVVCLPQKPTFESAELSCRFPVPLGFFSSAYWVQYVLIRGHCRRLPLKHHDALPQKSRCSHSTNSALTQHYIRLLPPHRPCQTPAHVPEPPCKWPNGKDASSSGLSRCLSTDLYSQVCCMDGDLCIANKMPVRPASPARTQGQP